MTTDGQVLLEIEKEAPSSPYSCIYAVKSDGVVKLYVDGVLKNEIPVSGVN